MSPSAAPALRWVKWLVAMAALLALVGYLVHLNGLGRLRLMEGLLWIIVGDYHFKYELDWITALQWLGAGLLVALAAWGVPDLRARWLRMAAISLGLSLLLILLLTPWYGRFGPLGIETLTAVVLGGLGGWLLSGLPDVRSMLASDQPSPRGASHRLLLTAFILGAGVCAISWQFYYQGQPIITDSQSQITQARLLLHGRATHPYAQALRDVIQIPYAVAEAPSYSQFPPGYILALVPLVAAGLPVQLFNVLAGGLLMALTGWFAARLGGRLAGWIAVILLAGSPFFWIMGGTAMNHVACALALLAAACCFLPVVTEGRTAASPRTLVLGGLMLGWAVTMRPVTGLAHGLVWAAALAGVWLAGRRGRGHWQGVASRVALWGGLGLTLPALVFFVYDWLTTGHPLRMPYMTSNPTGHVLGFRESGPAHYTPGEAINNLVASLLSLHGLLLGWAIGSWTALAAWWIRARLGAGEAVLLGLILAQVSLYGLYHFFDLMIGPRFWFELLPIFVVLAAGGLAKLAAGRGRLAAGLLLGAVVLLSAAGPALPLVKEHNHYRQIIGRGLKVERFMNRLDRSQPTVVILSREEGEMIGRWFPALPWETPIFFVARQDEAAARALPELHDFRFVHLE